MKIKVGDTVYSNDDQPIMVILTELDKQYLAEERPAGVTLFCQYPKGSDLDEIAEWMYMEVTTDGHKTDQPKRYDWGK